VHLVIARVISPQAPPNRLAKRKPSGQRAVRRPAPVNALPDRVLKLRLDCEQARTRTSSPTRSAEPCCGASGHGRLWSRCPPPETNLSEIGSERPKLLKTTGFTLGRAPA
jgi:hypothetical protein